jgi:hypothetical protein
LRLPLGKPSLASHIRGYLKRALAMQEIDDEFEVKLGRIGNVRAKESNELSSARSPGDPEDRRQFAASVVVCVCGWPRWPQLAAATLQASRWPGACA